MKAKEIRAYKIPELTLDDKTDKDFVQKLQAAALIMQSFLLREIAAQLAELNEKKP